MHEDTAAFIRRYLDTSPNMDGLITEANPTHAEKMATDPPDDLMRRMAEDGPERFEALLEAVSADVAGPQRVVS